MKVVEVTTRELKTRYYLADDEGAPIEPVLQYLRFKDNASYARNTLRLHCFHLKHYFTFLKERNKDYKEANVDDLARFIGWLKNPDIEKRVIPLRLNPVHKAATINAIVDTVISFYKYHMLHEGSENYLSKKLVTFIKNPSRDYRSFLHGIAPSKPTQSHMLKMPVPKQVVKTIKKEDVVILLEACNNERDYFLLYLLFETGMRIGEALSLWVEDFELSERTIQIKDRGETENLAEIKTVHSERKLNATIDLMDLFSENICLYHDEKVKTNHVFIKLLGKYRGQAMNYSDVDNVFRALRKKTGIYITPHMFRHTSLSLLHSAGWEPELLKERAGHKNIYTTLNTYVHPSEEEVANAFHEV
ncbi:MAG: tyrosine-type recombinase/integrase, partial [Lachnospiraceae bacterium]